MQGTHTAHAFILYSWCRFAQAADGDGGDDDDDVSRRRAFSGKRSRALGKEECGVDGRERGRGASGRGRRREMSGRF